MRPAIALPLALLLAFAACGGDGDDDAETSPTAFIPQDTAPAPTVVLQPQPQPAQPLDAEASAVTGGLIEIGTANFLFAPNRWAVALDETVNITLTNADTQQHNLRLAGLDGQYDTEDDVITSPNAIGPGQTGEVSFVPQVAGNYTFRCDFHATTMGGQIEVQ